MEVEVLYEDPRWEASGFDVMCAAAFEAVAQHQGLGAGWEVSVLACDDARIAVLNEAFRDKGRATNVLSWPSDERGAVVDGAVPVPPEGPDPELGDIAIAYETCAQEAAEQGKAFKDHVTHLLVHACLHLLGYDHIRPLDAALMEGIEVEILASLSIANPYEDSGGA